MEEKVWIKPELLRLLWYVYKRITKDYKANIYYMIITEKNCCLLL